MSSGTIVWSGRPRPLPLILTLILIRSIRDGPNNTVKERRFSAAQGILGGAALQHCEKNPKKSGLQL